MPLMGKLFGRDDQPVPAERQRRRNFTGDLTPSDPKVDPLYEFLKGDTFPPEVTMLDAYLNDIRFDLRRGKEGMAFITDSSEKGPNGIVVVDLATGKSWRRLNNHPSTRPSPPARGPRRSRRPAWDGRSIWKLNSLLA